MTIPFKLDETSTSPKDALNNESTVAPEGLAAFS